MFLLHTWLKTIQLQENITFENKELVRLLLFWRVLDSSTTHSTKTIMVLFVAAFLETHVFIAPCTRSLGPYHREHSRAIAYYTYLPQLCKDRIAITS
jgi:hypothetical protein